VTDQRVCQKESQEERLSEICSPDAPLQGQLSIFCQGGIIDRHFGRDVCSQFIRDPFTLGGGVIQKDGMAVLLLDDLVLECDKRQPTEERCISHPAIACEDTYHLVAVYQGMALCSLGFQDFSPTILVRQIQGVRGQGSLLSSFYFGRALLMAMINWSTAVGVDCVSVLGAENNKWAKESYWYLQENCIFQGSSFRKAAQLSSSEEWAIRRGAKDKGIYVGLLPSQAFRLYDQNALAVGFSPDGRGNYELLIQK